MSRQINQRTKSKEKHKFSRSRCWPALCKLRPYFSSPSDILWPWEKLWTWGRACPRHSYESGRRFWFQIWWSSRWKGCPWETVVPWRCKGWATRRAGILQSRCCDCWCWRKNCGWALCVDGRAVRWKLLSALQSGYRLDRLPKSSRRKQVNKTTVPEGSE